MEPDINRQALTGQRVIITGGNSGIGLVTAKQLAAKGATVLIAGRASDKTEAALQSINAEAVTPARNLAVDLGSLASVEALIESVQREGEPIDVLINNAGLGHKTSLIDGETPYWREMLEVNVLALSICTREALSQMRKNGDDGYIIHVSSMSAHRVPSNSGMYSATKFAVRSLTEGLRQELRQIGSNIRVSSISPGFVETEFAEKTVITSSNIASNARTAF